MQLKNKFLLFLIIYLSFYIISRLVISGSLDRDEAEMVLLSQQSFQLGYNSQPPLYAWLQLAFFSIFGLNIFSLTFLKHLLIFIMYFFIYKSAWEITKNQLCAVFSAISLLLVYNFEWVFHKDLTHTVLLITLCAITFYVFLKLLEKQTLKYYILLGVFIGLGFLSKHNYIFFIMPLMLSALNIKDFRKVIINKKILFTFLIVIIFTGPSLLWYIKHKNVIMADKYKFYMAKDNYIKGIKNGLLVFVREIFYFILPLILMYLIFFRQGFKFFKPKIQEDKNTKWLLARFFCFSAIIFLIAIIFFRVTNIEARWLLPFLFLIPTYFFIRLKDTLVSKQQVKGFIIIVFITASFFALSIPGRVIFADIRNKYTRWNIPYLAVAETIKKQDFYQGLIIADNFVLGAGLKLYFKDSLVVTPDNKIPYTPSSDFTKILIIWEVDNRQKVPELFNDLLTKFNLLLNNQTVGTSKFLYRYSKNKYYTISYSIIDKSLITDIK